MWYDKTNLFRHLPPGPRSRRLIEGHQSLFPKTSWSAPIREVLSLRISSNLSIVWEQKRVVSAFWVRKITHSSLLTFSFCLLVTMRRGKAHVTSSLSVKLSQNRLWRFTNQQNGATKVWPNMFAPIVCLHHQNRRIKHALRREANRQQAKVLVDTSRQHTRRLLEQISQPSVTWARKAGQCSYDFLFLLFAMACDICALIKFVFITFCWSNYIRFGSRIWWWFVHDMAALDYVVVALDFVAWKCLEWFDSPQLERTRLLT